MITNYTQHVTKKTIPLDVVALQNQQAEGHDHEQVEGHEQEQVQWLGHVLVR